MDKHQEVLRDYKERVFNEAPGPGDVEMLAAGIKKEVFEAWRKTKRLGISQDLVALPKTSNDRTVLDRLLSVTKLDWSLAQNDYKTIGELFKALGACMYFLDDRMAIFNYIGDEALIDDLKTFGFKFGYRMSAEYIGAFPPNLLSKNNRKCIMAGEEHPLSRFSDLCSVSMAVRTGVIAPFREFDSTLWEGSYSLLLIMPLDRYDKTAEDICDVAMNKFIPMCSENSIKSVYADLFSLSEEANQTPIAYISASGKVLYVNKCFENEFGIAFDLCLGCSIEAMIPELDFLRDTLKKQLKLKFQKVDIVAAGLKRAYYLQTHFLRRDGKVYAMKLSISTQGNINYYVKNIGMSGNSAIFTFDSIIGNSPGFARAKQLARRTASSSSNVLILGESGTGKELFSQAIHNESDRRNKPFLAINCGSIPKELIGSELFGYEDGAFTGARKEGQVGKFELASGGTLFLDEIAEMPLDMQSYLLRVLEEGKVYRLGGTKPQSVDVRVISATNRDLWSYVNEGKFRLDLYFRLNIIKIEIPPLRERKDDIDELVSYYLKKLSADFDKPIRGMAPEVLGVFKKYSWPGNVRELRNVLEYSVNMVDGEYIQLRDIPGDMLRKMESGAGDAEKDAAEDGKWSSLDYKTYERQQIKELMIKFKGNKSRVAQEMGIARNTLNKRLQEMQLAE